jgi:hypothetical protein
MQGNPPATSYSFSRIGSEGVRRLQKKPSGRRANWKAIWVGAGVVVAVGLVIGLSIASGLNKNLKKSPTPPPVAAGDRKEMGPKDAPVTLIKYQDYL